MTENHPITPPPELVQQWWEESNHRQYTGSEAEDYVISMAAQYGADQELEACCEYVYERLKLTTVAHIAQDLRTSRRPKPPSLKEQALEELEELRGDANSMGMGFDAPAIRRALEQLPDNE